MGSSAYILKNNSMESRGHIVTLSYNLKRVKLNSPRIMSCLNCLLNYIKGLLLKSLYEPSQCMLVKQQNKLRD